MGLVRVTSNVGRLVSASRFQSATITVITAIAEPERPSHCIPGRLGNAGLRTSRHVGANFAASRPANGTYPDFVIAALKRRSPPPLSFAGTAHLVNGPRASGVTVPGDVHANVRFREMGRSARAADMGAERTLSQYVLHVGFPPDPVVRQGRREHPLRGHGRTF